MPWMTPATQEVWRALRLNASAGDPVHLPPLLLNGPPGIGKSVWARRLSELLHMPRCEIDASMGGIGFAVVGTERGWSSAQPGRPLETILQHRIGNPLIVIDEICKSRSVTAERDSSHSFADSLLNLLEPATSVAWEYPFYRTKIDMSHISWVLTTNDTPMVPGWSGCFAGTFQGGLLPQRVFDGDAHAVVLVFRLHFLVDQVTDQRGVGLGWAENDGFSFSLIAFNRVRTRYSSRSLIWVRRLKAA